MDADGSDPASGAAPRSGDGGARAGDTRPIADAPSRAARIAGGVGAAGRRASGAGRRAGAAGRRAGALGSRGARAAWRRFRRLTHARGAGESGLARVIELHLAASIADALIVTALASTIFFAVPTQQARGRVATSLLITMVPFTLLAPVIGPLLDRVRRGRRYALATTMVVRAFLAWVMAGAVGTAEGSDAAFALYPAAFGFLVCQKAYIVTRAAALPRVLPEGTGLVAANSRISLAGVAALAIGGPVGAGLTAWAGPSWTLRLAFVVFAASTVLALALTDRIDSGEGEVAARISTDAQPGRAGTERRPRPERRPPGGDPLIADLARGGPGPRPVPARPAPAARPAQSPRPTPTARPTPTTPGTPGPSTSSAARKGRASWNIGPRVVLGLRANAALRAFTGFLTLFLAFRLRTEPLNGFSESASVVLVVVLAAVGGGVGTGLGSVLARITPETVVVLVLGVTALVAAWSALLYGAWAVGAVALAAGTAQSLGKLCLDALIQREVPERVRTSAFARSETVLQLAWVIGGGIGLALPLSGAWGLGVAAAGTAAVAVAVLLTLIRMRRADDPRSTS